MCRIPEGYDMSVEEPEMHRVGLELAFEQAHLAYSAQELPIGCVILGPNGLVMAQTYNKMESRGDKTAHAEILALQEVAEKNYTQTSEPNGWTLYTTLEPCPMCLTAIVFSGIGKVVWATKDPRLEKSNYFDELPYKSKNKLLRVAHPLKDLEDKGRRIYEIGLEARKARRMLQTLPTRKKLRSQQLPHRLPSVLGLASQESASPERRASL